MDYIRQTCFKRSENELYLVAIEKWFAQWYWGRFCAVVLGVMFHSGIEANAYTSTELMITLVLGGNVYAVELGKF